jgi:hypothetical protein
MHYIDIYGFADVEICGACTHDGCGTGACVPGAKKRTKDLVSEFEGLLKKEKIDATVAFFEATDENITRHPDVHKLLSTADLTPAIVMDDKLLFLGGFSPEGLADEVRKRV